MDRINVQRLTKDEAFAYLETVLEAIKKTLETAEDLKINGFGSFVVRKKESRKGRNPQTGAPITITVRRILTFKPSTLLHRRLTGR